MLVRTLLGIDLLVALVVVYFFVIGLADGSVSSFNMSLWLGLLAAVAAAVGGGWLLNANGRRGAAIAALSILALPGILYGLFVLLIVIAQPV
ncbi:MAG TPA: hypothetical protein VFN63_12310 [Pseudolabrys sp.]|jgi:hypothetical protein|nr:hypothetical protein [Pseudolabrys sp.]